MRKMVYKEFKKLFLDKKIKIFFIIVFIMQMAIFINGYRKWSHEVQNIDAYTKFANEYQGKIQWDIIDSSLLKKISGKVSDTNKADEKTKTYQDAFRFNYHKTALTIMDRKNYMMKLSQLKQHGQTTFDEELMVLQNMPEPPFTNSHGINLFSQNIIGIISSFIIVISSLIIVSFQESIDRLSNFDQIVISSKYGSKKIFKAKSIADYIFVTILISIYYIFFLLLYLIMYKNYAALGYKLNGMGAFTYITSDITIGYFLVNSYFRIILGALAITSVLLMIQRVVKNKITSNVVGLVILFLPLALPRIGKISKIIVLSPILDVQGQFAHEGSLGYTIFSHYVPYSSLSLITLVAVFFICNVVIQWRN